MVLQRGHRLLERLELHKERLAMMPAEACAIGAPMRTGIGDVDLDNFLIGWRFQEQLQLR
jgi:hypothetical protein